MILNAFYKCPAGHQIALEVDALDDVHETLRHPEKTLMKECWTCDGSQEREYAVKGSMIVDVGVCELTLGKISQ